MIASSGEKMATLQIRFKEALNKIAAIETSCKTAGSGEADDDLIAKLESLKEDEAAIKQMEAALYAAVDLTWPTYMKSHKAFKVMLDVAPSQFDDSAWTGDWRTDQMGTIRGGETYTLIYTKASSWQATGLNEKTAAKGTWTYLAGEPDDFQLNIWGRVYSFDDQGNVYDPDFGLVGHLAK
jgi:hypothetical protein